MRFVTLSSAKEGKWYRAKDGSVKQRTIRESWQALRAKIARATIEKDGFQGFNLNKYIAFRTSEGNGVYHIIFWGGRFIPYKWLSDAWKEIHGAWNVSIEYVHKRRKKISSLVGYLLDRYLLNQPIKRMSYGWGWAWVGFCKSWENLKSVYCEMRKGQFSYDSEGKIVYDQWHYDQILNDYVNYVPFKKRYSHKAVSAWKSILGNVRVTSRQIKLTKFF